jgi:hypothetical protein
MNSSLWEWDDPTGWKDYPLGVECYSPTGFDRSFCRDKLFDISENLFQRADGGIKLYWTERQGRRTLLF